jgi:hypothetical protein
MTETPDLPPQTRPAGFRLPLGRRGLVITAMTITGAGMALNWGWLTAIGAAPLILGLAPCAVMCATGYCVMRKSKAVTPTRAQPMRRAIRGTDL